MDCKNFSCLATCTTQVPMLGNDRGHRYQCCGVFGATGTNAGVCLGPQVPMLGCDQGHMYQCWGVIGASFSFCN